MDEGKVQTIKNWPIPKRVKDIQSFLGFANFYQRFICNYSDLVMETLDSTELLMEDQAWLDYLWDFKTREINLDLSSDTD